MDSTKLQYFHFFAILIPQKMFIGNWEWTNPWVYPMEQGRKSIFLQSFSPDAYQHSQQANATWSHTRERERESKREREWERENDREREKVGGERRHQTHLIDEPGCGTANVWSGPQTGRWCFTPGFTQHPRLSLCPTEASQQMWGRQSLSFILLGRKAMPPPLPPLGIPSPRRWKASVRTCLGQGNDNNSAGNVTTFVWQVGGNEIVRVRWFWMECLVCVASQCVENTAVFGLPLLQKK